MNQNLTEIVFILDRSGSMGSLIEAAIWGFNEFLRNQQAEPGEARFTLVLFDDQYEVLCASVPIREVIPLDTTTYVPRGPLRCSMRSAKSIDELGNRLSAMAERDRPGKVIVAVLTDGLENASRHYTWHGIADRIRHQTDVYKWDFLFLGANQDAIATASRVNIGARNTASFLADSAGVKASAKAISRKMAAMRKMQAGQPDADLDAPMSDILKEEDGKEREGGKNP